MPKVSIIIPVYNTEEYLSTCLDSITHQTLTDIEIICIDDNSSDNSLVLLQKYAKQDNRFKIINFQTHKGVSIARNEGLKAATGDYVGFVDSDDSVDLDFYEKLYVRAKETDADIVKGDLKEIFPNGKISTYPQNENILKCKNKLCFYISFTSAIYRRELQKKEKVFFDHRLVHTEDLVWLNRMVTAANIVEIVPNIYYLYQRRGGSTDTLVLSNKNAASAYIGMKHIFLNTLSFAQSEKIDCSKCYEDYWNGVLSFVFRSPNIQTKKLFCRLLFFFYKSLPDFFHMYLTQYFRLFLPYFAKNELDSFVNFIKTKHSFKDVVIENLRHNVLQQMKQKPKLSIIIPVYNAQNYIKPCLDSACNQTYSNLEIICVNDCSTDDSLSILEEYAAKDKRIRIIQTEENGGQAAARQKGIDASTGAYIGFIDNDDWLDCQYYEAMIDRAQQDRTDIIINGNIQKFYENGKTAPYFFPGHKLLEHRVYDNPIAIIDKVFCVVWNKIFRGDFLRQRRYTIPYRQIVHEDVFFHYSTFAFAQSVSFFMGPAYYYLSREGSFTAKKRDWGVEHIRVYSKIYDFYKENNLLDKKIKLYSTMPFFVIKTPEMFDEYKNYFIKIWDYMTKNKDVFNSLDLFFAKGIIESVNYADYISKYHQKNPLIAFLRSQQ